MAAKRKISLALVLCAVLALTGCRAESLPVAEVSPATNEEASVYVLNPAPEQDSQWQQLAALYTQQSGVPVTVVSPEEGSYEAVLKEEMTKIEAPTLFTFTAEQLPDWSGYAWDLSDSAAYAALSVPFFAYGDGETVQALPWSLRSYGLLVNDNLVGEAEHDFGELSSLEGLRALAEDVTWRREQLGFAAFASLGLSGAGGHSSAALLADAAARCGADGESFKTVWDLYTANSSCQVSELPSLSADAGLEEFCAGKAVFCLAGSWEYPEIRAALPEARLLTIPVAFPAGEEESQVLWAQAEDFWMVNKDADLNDIQATLDFVSWCLSAPEGLAALQAMGYAPPYAGNTDGDPFIECCLEQIAAGAVPDSGELPETWTGGLPAALAEYCTEGSWDAAAAILPASEDAGE